MGIVSDNDIVLRSGNLQVCEIKRKTKTRLFRELKVGDIITIETPIQYTGGASKGNYVLGVKVKNIKTGYFELMTINEVNRMLNHHFTIKPIE